MSNERGKLDEFQLLRSIGRLFRIAQIVLFVLMVLVLVELAHMERLIAGQPTWADPLAPVIRHDPTMVLEPLAFFLWIFLALLLLLLKRAVIKKLDRYP
jgi:hypothetical protein